MTLINKKEGKQMPEEEKKENELSLEEIQKQGEDIQRSTVLQIFKNMPTDALVNLVGEEKADAIKNDDESSLVVAVNTDSLESEYEFGNVLFTAAQYVAQSYAHKLPVQEADMEKLFMENLEKVLAGFTATAKVFFDSKDKSGEEPDEDIKNIEDKSTEIL